MIALEVVAIGWTLVLEWLSVRWMLEWPSLRAKGEKGKSIFVLEPLLGPALLLLTSFIRSWHVPAAIALILLHLSVFGFALTRTRI